MTVAAIQATAIRTTKRNIKAHTNEDYSTDFHFSARSHIHSVVNSPHLDSSSSPATPASADLSADIHSLLARFIVEIPTDESTEGKSKADISSEEPPIETPLDDEMTPDGLALRDESVPQWEVCQEAWEWDTEDEWGIAETETDDTILYSESLTLDVVRRTTPYEHDIRDDPDWGTPRFRRVNEALIGIVKDVVPIPDYVPRELEAEFRKAAKDELVARHYPYVFALAQRSYNRGKCGEGTTLSDLIAAGVEGLLMALEKFDPHRGVTLLTYATQMIFRCLHDECEQDSNLIRVPSSRRSQLGELNETMRRLWGHAIPLARLTQEQREELAAQTGIDLTKPTVMRGLLDAISALQIKSFSEVMAEEKDGDELSVDEIIAYAKIIGRSVTGSAPYDENMDVASGQMDELIAHRIRVERLRMLIEKLPEMDRLLLLGYGQGWSLREIAVSLAEHGYGHVPGENEKVKAVQLPLFGSDMLGGGTSSLQSQRTASSQSRHRAVEGIGYNRARRYRPRKPAERVTSPYSTERIRQLLARAMHNLRHAQYRREIDKV